MALAARQPWLLDVEDSVDIWDVDTGPLSPSASPQQGPDQRKPAAPGPPQAWALLQGGGTYSVRDSTSGAAGYVDGGTCAGDPAAEWTALACNLQGEQQSAVANGGYQLSFEFKCSKSGSSSSPAVFQLILSWTTHPDTGQIAYTALQADCETQRWSVVYTELPRPVSADGLTPLWAGARHVELASAPDVHLSDTQFSPVEVRVQKGSFLSVRRPHRKTSLFSHLSLRTGSSVAAALHAALRSNAAHGASDGMMSVNDADSDVSVCARGAGAGAAVVPVCGPLGLAVQDSRIEFRYWCVRSVQSKHSTGGKGGGGKDTGSAKSSPQASSRFAADRATQQSPSQTQPAPHSPAAVQEALAPLAVSSAVATAVAVSTAGAAASRWSRKPHIADADPILVEAVMADIIRPSEHPPVTFDHIASHTHAKQVLQEAVVLPAILPELFTGIRAPWKGVLLFGPPGTGKTMLARAVAATAGVTFFAPSSATLTSKWRGDSEKAVRTLFAVAQHFAPSIIFIDEIDALVSTRDMDGEGDASRRFKAELLQQMDGLVSSGSLPAPGSSSSKANRCVIVLAATNTPWDLDAALRRRLEKRLYIPLPDESARRQMFDLHLKDVVLGGDVDLDELAACTEGYSGADLKNMCRDAAMAPMRRLVAGKSVQQLKALRFSLTSSLSPAPPTQTPGALVGPASSTAALVSSRLVVGQADLMQARENIQPSVTQSQVRRYEKWDQQFAAV